MVFVWAKQETVQVQSLEFNLRQIVFGNDDIIFRDVIPFEVRHAEHRLFIIDSVIDHLSRCMLVCCIVHQGCRKQLHEIVFSLL